MQIFTRISERRIGTSNRAKEGVETCCVCMFTPVALACKTIAQMFTHQFPDFSQTLFPRDLVSHGRCARKLVFQVEQACAARVAAMFQFKGGKCTKAEHTCFSFPKHGRLDV